MIVKTLRASGTTGIYNATDIAAIGFNQKQLQPVTCHIAPNVADNCLGRRGPPVRIRPPRPLLTVRIAFQVATIGAE
jgi:hypothetical protein